MIRSPLRILQDLPSVARQVDAGLGSRSCILIAGSGRSGTTWLADVVARATRSRVVFEPFVHDQNRRLKVLESDPVPQTDYQVYIPAGIDSSAYDAALRKILRGGVRHRWCDRQQQTGLFFRRVVKGIRCNLMLGYIANRWPRTKSIFVTRNPLSVVNSQVAQIHQGWKFEWEPSFVLDQPNLMEDWLAPFHEQIVSASSQPAKQALKWAIENYIPRKQLNEKGNVLFVRYEDLVHGERGWSRVMRFLGEHCWSRKRWRDAVGQISATARRTADDIQRGIDEHDQLSTDDKYAVKKIVTQFGLESYLDHVPVPERKLTARTRPGRLLPVTRKRSCAKILIVSSAGVRNHGDDAILLSTRQRLGRVRPFDQLTIVTDGAAVGNVAPPAAWWGTSRQLCQLLDTVGIRDVCGDERLASELMRLAIGTESPDPQASPLPLADFDVILFCGGGNLCGLWPQLVARRAAIAAAATAIGVPYIVSGQGVGPLSDQVVPMIRPLVDGATQFAARDPVSANLLRKTLACSSRISVVGDDALGLAREPIAQVKQTLAIAGVPLDRPLLGFHARQSRGVAISTSSQMSIAAEVDSLASKNGFAVVAIPINSQGLGERRLLHSLATDPARRAPWLLVDTGDNVAATSAVTKSCSAVVTQSHHVALFALEQRIPTLYVAHTEYARRKSRGLSATSGVPCSITLDPESTAAEMHVRLAEMRQRPWSGHIRGEDVDQWLEQAIDAVLGRNSARSLRRNAKATRRPFGRAA